MYLLTVVCRFVGLVNSLARFLFSHLIGDVLNMLPVVVSRKGHTILTMRILAKNSVNTVAAIR